MTPRVQWSDIAKAARETSEALNGKDWVDAGIKARVLLADLADEVDRLKATIEAQGLELADFREIDPVPDEGDGTHRLCMALYGYVKARKYIGGSNARMLHDAATEIGRLRTVNEAMAKSHRELIGAMRRYEMNAEEEAPDEHRKMMERADAALASHAPGVDPEGSDRP